MKAQATAIFQACSPFGCAIMVSLWLYSCSDSSQTTATTPVPEANTVDASTVKKAVWPYLIEGEAINVVTDNLLQRNYYVVFDGSGSMLDSGCSGGTSKNEAAKRALSRFSKAVPEAANIGLLVFDRHGVSERVALGIHNREQFNQSVQSVVPAGSTPLKSAIQAAFEQLNRQGKAQLGYGEYHLIVVTDGEATANEDPTGVVNTILATSPVTIHTIGFCIGKHHSLNQAGRILYKAADNYESLEKGLEDVLAESPEFMVGKFN